jgi:hypothetical protein
MDAERDWSAIVGKPKLNQYEQRINFLKSKGIDTQAIEKAVDTTLKSINTDEFASFVIFGEPQSGKTEMMIALNAKLLDTGCEVIINLITDSVDLLQQSYSRFMAAGLSPSPKQFSELPSEAKDIRGKQWLIFSKKNAKDLEKLTTSLRFVKKLIIIDDEADFASPNAKVNKGERTKINELIHELLKNRGTYIGVTATPARLDLNNTFENNTELWVDFDPHPLYVGQDFFFPSSGVINYNLHQFDPHTGNDRSELQNAVLHFLCGVAKQHINGNEQNFSMLVHTSGKTLEHKIDYEIVERTIGDLASQNARKFDSILSKLTKVSAGYSEGNGEDVIEFVLRNINKNHISEINSKRTNQNIEDVLKPKSLFTFGVGGNIISRGVTFEFLLSMYFTRGVKGRLSQDTYIQRARMFGNRNKYKNDFQLWIPTMLLDDWAKCFTFHRLAIQSARAGMGAPVWLSDFRSTPTAVSSIDKSSVDFEFGEMSFGMFAFQSNKNYCGDTSSYMDRLLTLKASVPEKSFPEHIYRYLVNDITGDDDVCFHSASPFGTSRSAYTQSEIDDIRRAKGIFSTNEFARGDNPNARHHLKIYFNANGKARLFYKIRGKSIKFMQNKK